MLEDDIMNLIDGRCHLDGSFNTREMAKDIIKLIRNQPCPHGFVSPIFCVECIPYEEK